MKILKAPQELQTPTIASMVQFDPWPFQSDCIDMSHVWLFIPEKLYEPEGWGLTRAYNVLATLTDGRSILVAADELEQFVEQFS